MRSKRISIRNLVRLACAVTVGTAAGMAGAAACLWEGKAPLCNGECRPGYTLIKRDKSGDGDKCVTGSKAYCCMTSAVVIRGTAPLCNGKCKEGEEMMGESDYGPNGKKCETGKAAVCGIPVK